MLLYLEKFFSESQYCFFSKFLKIDEKKLLFAYQSLNSNFDVYFNSNKVFDGYVR